MARVGIALLCAGAVVMIVVILSSGHFDTTSGEAVFTALAIAFLSLIAVAGVNLAERQPGIAALGYLTILASLVALAASANVIWSHPLFSDSGGARTAAYALLAAFTLGNSSALLAGHDDDDADSVKLVRLGTVCALWALAITAAVAIHQPSSPINPHQAGVTAVLYGLGVLVLPLLRLAER